MSTSDTPHSRNIIHSMQMAISSRNTEELYAFAGAARAGIEDLENELNAARAELAERKPRPSDDKKLWLWKNFVDGKPEYWAFDNPFPIHLDNGDPQTLGEPCGYAFFIPSRVGRTDVNEDEVLRRIKPTSPCPHLSTSKDGTSYCRLAELPGSAASNYEERKRT